MQILLDNLPPDATSDDVQLLLVELGVPAVIEIKLHNGAERSSALIRLDLSNIAVATICTQLNGRHWHGRDLTANHTTFTWD